ncbi:MAG: hypothetical protein LBL66_07885 [Clostridiales bacterium]|jgi:hypothetical protein|nr:hypothetical protein [Clostridiales bacterium]
MIQRIVDFFNGLIAGMSPEIVLAVTFGILAAVFLILLFVSFYPKRFNAETGNVLAAMRDHPEDTGLLDVCMGRFPGDIPELWKKYRSGGTVDAGMYIDQKICVEAPMGGRAMRVISMGMSTILIAAIALALGVAVNGGKFNGVGIFPALVVLLSGVVFMSVLHVLWGRRYKKVLRSYYTLMDVLTLNLPRRGMLFLPPAGGAKAAGVPRRDPPRAAKREPRAEPVAESVRPAVEVAPESDGPEILISPAAEPERAAKIVADETDAAPRAGSVETDEPEKEDIVEKIDRVINENASKQTMLEVAKLLSAERRKPENQKPVQQKRLNDALAKLLKALSAKK